MEFLQSFSGVLVNTLTVIIGGTVGLLLKKQIPEKPCDNARLPGCFSLLKEQNF
jgi:uncharacterized membrane protein YqgA involved in biofilm formation